MLSDRADKQSDEVHKLKWTRSSTVERRAFNP